MDGKEGNWTHLGTGRPEDNGSLSTAQELGTETELGTGGCACQGCPVCRGRGGGGLSHCPFQPPLVSLCRSPHLCFLHLL